MKTILPVLILTILIALQTNAQRNPESGGRGQESGRIDRIQRIQHKQPTIDKHQRMMERPP